MMIEVHVHPSAKENKIQKLSENIYGAWVKEPAKDNKANFALIKLLSDHFGKPQSSLRIVRGQKGRIKSVLI